MEDKLILIDCRTSEPEMVPFQILLFPSSSLIPKFPTTYLTEVTEHAVRKQKGDLPLQEKKVGETSPWKMFMLQKGKWAIVFSDAPDMSSPNSPVLPK